MTAHMPRPMVWVLRAMVIVIVLVLLAGGYFIWLFDWNRLRTPLGDAASERANRKIVINGDIKVRWGWPASHLEVGGIEVGNIEQASAPQMLAIDSLSLNLDLKSLLTGDLRFRNIHLIKPQLILEKLPDGSVNWQFADNPAGSVALAPLPDSRGEFPIIDNLLIEDGLISYRNLKSGTTMEVRAATVQGDAGKSTDELSFEGKGIVRGQPFRFSLSGGSVVALRDSAAPFPISATVVAGSTHASIQGTVSDPIAMKGLAVTMRVGGNNAADLFPLTGIALLPTPPYEVAGQLEYADDVWVFRDFAGRMGRSDLSGQLRWDTRATRPRLTASFKSERLDLADLKGFIGVKPQGEDEDERVIPDLPLDISRLQAMDADVDFSGVRLISENMPVDDFHAHFLLENRVLEVKPVRFGSGAGNVAMWIRIDARKQPVHITTHAEVSRLSIAKALENASSRLGEENMTQGYLGGTADLSGTGVSLRDMLASANGQIGLGMEGGQMSHLIVELLGLDVAESVGYLIAGDKPVPIRCLIGDFEVTQGEMRARALVFDTSDTIVRGEGGIDLRDETLDLQLKPAPKDFSPLVLRAPLELRGTLKEPRAVVSKRGLIGRGVVAALLAVIMPPAAILAFIEPGLGEDSQCHALLNLMSQNSEDPGGNRELVPKNPAPAP